MEFVTSVAILFVDPTMLAWGGFALYRHYQNFLDNERAVAEDDAIGQAAACPIACRKIST
jgi:hypothetical protein